MEEEPEVFCVKKESQAENAKIGAKTKTALDRLRRGRDSRLINECDDRRPNSPERLPATLQVTTMPDSTQDDNASPQRDPPPEAPDKPADSERKEDDAPEPEKQVAEEKTRDETVEENPPLPPGPPPEDQPDYGWQPVWDPTYSRYYFYNTYTQETTWQNPRIPEADAAAAEAASPDAAAPGTVAEVPHDPLRYNPAIHGDYDPTAPYAQVREEAAAPGQEPDFTVTAAFNRFTGKFQPAQSHMVPENYNADNKSKRQMQFYFDVDAAANSHEGRSLKAERQAKKLSKKELKQFKEKRKQKKEEKRKAWLKD